MLRLVLKWKWIFTVKYEKQKNLKITYRPKGQKQTLKEDVLTLIFQLVLFFTPGFVFKQVDHSGIWSMSTINFSVKYPQVYRFFIYTLEQKHFPKIKTILLQNLTNHQTQVLIISALLLVMSILETFFKKSYRVFNH